MQYWETPSNGEAPRRHLGGTVEWSWEAHWDGVRGTLGDTLGGTLEQVHMLV